VILQDLTPCFFDPLLFLQDLTPCFLLRWLCRGGKVRDREVDFSALRASLVVAKGKVYDAGVRFFMLIHARVKKARHYTPYIMAGFAVVWQWFDRMRMKITNRQKRIGNNN
jgi:hypothetical protein